MRQNLLKNPFFEVSKNYKELDMTNKGFVRADDFGKYLSMK